MNVNEAVARILKTEGVEWIACFPSNELLEAVAKEGIRPILFRQERGALMAADLLPRMYPMMITAAGTITPAKGLVLGAGVAGLVAIATSRRFVASLHAPLQQSFLQPACG